MNLTEHFTLEELTYSDTAIKYHAYNLPTELHLKTLKHTCEYFLESLRSLLNLHFVGMKVNNKKVVKVLIKITSGYRSKLVNNLLKEEGYHPSETSQHCTGEAVDIEAIIVFEDNSRTKINYKDLFNLIKNWVKIGRLSVDQCIQEKQGSMLWVHCSYSAWGASKNRKDFKVINI